MKPITSYEKLEDLGRVRLSESFFMRDFLYSEIAAWHGLRNVPDQPGRAIEVGRSLCVELLEPLQATFGRIHIRSGYRSPAVNDFGNKKKLNCASNESNLGGHIWDYPDKDGKQGATACIVLPWLVDHIECGGKWTDMAWWIHDHLPYSSLCYFAKLGAFNINWREVPERRIDSFADPKGCLTCPGMANHTGSHAGQYLGFPQFHATSRTSQRSPVLAGAAALPKPVFERSIPPSADAPIRAATAPVASGHIHTKAGARILYRAVHTKTAWRKVLAPHSSMENALFGKDGAAGLFAGKVRIDYEKHGQPLYVLVWQRGSEKGYVVKADSTQPKGIRIVETSTAALDAFDHAAACDVQVLAAFF